MQEGKSSATPRQGGVDTEQNTGDVGYSADDGGNTTDDAGVPAPGSADGGAGIEDPQPRKTDFSNPAQDRAQPSGTSSEQQQYLDGDIYAKKSSQEPGYPATQGGGGDGAHEEDIQQEHHFDGPMDSKPPSPVGFGVEDDGESEQSERAGAEGFDRGGYGGREIEDDGMHPISSQPLRGRHQDRSAGNEGDGHTGTGTTKGLGFDEANDDAGSRGQRMFDGSRVAEPDDVEIVDAGEGADIIPGVDDLPVFANDQSKALNDEIKVREG